MRLAAGKGSAGTESRVVDVNHPPSPERHPGASSNRLYHGTDPSSLPVGIPPSSWLVLYKTYKWGSGIMNAVTAISVADARSDLAELLNRVAYGKERLVITRHGRELAAIVPVEDLKLATRLRRFVARKDVARALAGLDTGQAASWDQLKSELGL